MADDLLYHFSDEDAFDQWEQMGGGSAQGPLFQFTKQPIGRRRRWREVVERAQFRATAAIEGSCGWGQYWDGFNRSVTPGHRDGTRPRAATR